MTVKDRFKFLHPLFFLYEEFMKYCLLLTALREGSLLLPALELTFMGCEMRKECLSS